MPTRWCSKLVPALTPKRRKPFRDWPPSDSNWPGRHSGKAIYREADTEIIRVLKVDPQNAAALAFKKQNDQMIAAMNGQMPDEATVQQAQFIANDKTDAGTLVRDGKLLYEMGKFEEAEAKLKEALRLDQVNQGAFYYLNLIKQGVYSRRTNQDVDTESRMEEVKKGCRIPV